MPTQYTGVEPHPQVPDEFQPAPYHNVTKSLLERVEDLEKEIKEIREELP